MGQCKKYMMDREFLDRENVKYPSDIKFVCADCFDDKYIKEYIRENCDKDAICTYTKKKGAASLNYVLDFIGEKVFTYFTVLDEDYLFLKSSFLDKDDDDIPGFKVAGPYITGADAEEFDSDDLMSEVGLSLVCPDLYDDIKNYFENYFGDCHTDFIQKDSCLPRYDNGLMSEWCLFEKNVKSDVAEESVVMGLYNDLFSEIEKNITDAHLYRKNLNIDFPGEAMYRCRCLGENEHVSVMNDIVSPPADKAKDNRMSEEGKSCFYGANILDIAKAEVGVGSNGNNHYAIGLLKIKAKDSINIIDLTATPKRLSYFAGYDFLAMKFLNRFSEEISKSNNGTHKDYLPTQYVTRELRRRFPYLNGIIYSSSKKIRNINRGKNVILFYDTQDCLKELTLECLKEILPGNIEKVIINKTITQQ